jgi:hypothetical protein
MKNKEYELWLAWKSLKDLPILNFSGSELLTISTVIDILDNKLKEVNNEDV